MNSFALSFYKVIVNGQKRCCLADKAEDVFKPGSPRKCLSQDSKPFFCIAQRKLDLNQNRSPWVPAYVVYPLCDSACLWALGHHASALPGVGRDHHSHLEQLRSQSRVNMPMESHQEIGLLWISARAASLNTYYVLIINVLLVFISDKYCFKLIYFLSPKLITLLCKLVPFLI